MRGRTQPLVGIISTTCAIGLAAMLATPTLAEAAGDPLAAPSRTIVIFGASYAKGWGKPQLPGFERVVNRGVGGDETSGMLARFDRDVAPIRPDAVLIWGHVNDITRSQPEALEGKKAAAKRHYAEMFDKARAAGIQIILATEIPWSEQTGILNTVRAWIGELRGRTSYATRVTAHVHELNQYLREEAAENHWILLDFERAFANESGTRKPEYAAADGSHISPVGYAVLTETARRELTRRSRPQAASSLPSRSSDFP
jgi:lysophospholipase L1-like esterase